MRLGYNTNGFPQHELGDVAEILAEAGYAAMAITPDVLQLDPFRASSDEVEALARRCRDLGLALAVETGARFLLDPRRKHQPTLLSAPDGARRRLEMLLRCLDLAVTLGAETLSFWSGTPEAGEEQEPARLLDRLCAGASALLDAAAGSGVQVCFEPEPGMLVDSLAQLARFREQLGRDDLAVMLDVGHVPVTESRPPHEVLAELGADLGGLQLDDSRGGVHEHLPPGEGEIDFAAVVAAARQVDFSGLACLELPRQGHDPVATAQRARRYFRHLGV